MAVVGREQERVAALRPGIGVDPQELPGRRRPALELLAADDAVHHRVELPDPGSPRYWLRHVQSQSVYPDGRAVALPEPHGLPPLVWRRVVWGKFVSRSVLCGGCR